MGTGNGKEVLKIEVEDMSLTKGRDGRIPGKLRARPVQHPATPALITANKHSTIIR